MSLNELYKKLNYNNGNIYENTDLAHDFSLKMTDIDYDSIYVENDEIKDVFKEYNSIEENRTEIKKLNQNLQNIDENPSLYLKLNNQYILYNVDIYNKNWTNKNHENTIKPNKIDDYLINNLKKTKEILKEKKLHPILINNIIARLILTKCLIDKKILKKENFNKIYNKSFEEIISDKTLLYSFFDFAKNKFEGDIFEISDNELEKIQNEHLTVLSSFFKGNDLNSNQAVLFNVYNFSNITQELINNIYNQKTNTQTQFLQDYIIEKSIQEKLNEKGTCKILDPQTKTDILTKALRKIIENQKKVNNSQITDIVKNNIFKIDIEEESIDASIFSIYITLLDYFNINLDFKFPKLKNKNFFNDDLFEINHINDFDCIITPYNQMTNKELTERLIPHINTLINDEGIVCLGCDSKILYNTQDKKYRQFLLNNFNIQRLFDLTLVKDNLSKNSPELIIFYKTKQDPDNYIEFVSIKSNHHVKLDKLIIETKDIKKIKQKYLINNDWLFKALLVGIILDINLIQRLKYDFAEINDFILNTPSLKSGEGFKKSEEKTDIDISSFYNLPYLKDINKFNCEASDVWNYKFAKAGNTEIMEPPYTLIKETHSDNFDFTSAFLDKLVVYDNNIYAIKGEYNDIKLLKNIMGLINSNLYKYFFLMTTNISIYKNKLSFKNRENFPFSNKICDNTELFNLVENIESSGLSDYYNEKLNKIIYDSYNMSLAERNLIDYTNEITIPTIKQEYDSLKKVNRELLDNYISIILKSLQKHFSSKNYQITANITDLIVAISFEFSDDLKSSVEFNWDENETLNRFNEFSWEKIGGISVKRDCKIINNSSITIIKTNTYSNWHEAIAWLDAKEFSQLIFQ